MAPLLVLVLLLLSSAGPSLGGGGDACPSACPANADRCRTVNGATWCYCGKGDTPGEINYVVA